MTATFRIGGSNGEPVCRGCDSLYDNFNDSNSHTDFITAVQYYGSFSYFFNSIDGVMVSGIAANAVDRGIAPRSGQTKDFKIRLVFANHAVLAKRTKIGWRGIRIMCPNQMTYLPVESCFSTLALNQSS